MYSVIGRTIRFRTECWRKRSPIADKGKIFSLLRTFLANLGRTYLLFLSVSGTPFSCVLTIQCGA